MNPLLLAAGLVAAILPGKVSADKSIKFINHCPYEIYSWNVGPAKSGWTGHDHDAVTIPANTVTYHGMVNGEEIGGGISMKLRDLPKYEVAPAGIVQLEYNLAPSHNYLWYDLSAVDCNRNAGPEDPSFCPLIRSGMKLYVEHADKGTCPPAWCGADGQCHNTYKEHGHWQGEPTFKCDAGKDIVVEFCTERAGPRTFDGHMEPGHHEPQPDEKPGKSTANGVCGASAPGGETCFGYTHGNCCSQYGWCGFSEAHCGTGCQPGFGDCFGQPAAKPSSYQPPAQSPSYNVPPKPSSVHPSYAKPTPSYYPPVSSYSSPAPIYYPPPSSYHQLSLTPTPEYSHIEHSWGYSKPTPSYAKPSSLESTPGYNKPSSSYYLPDSSYTPPAHKPSPSFVYSPAPSHSKPTPVYSKPVPSYAAPSHSKPTPVYSKPHSNHGRPTHSASTPIYDQPTPLHSSLYNVPSSGYAKPTHSKHTPAYSAPAHSKPPVHPPPAHTRSYSPPNWPPPYRTIYATHTITETNPPIIKTVTVDHYSAPHTPSAHHTPPFYPKPTPWTPVYSRPSHTPHEESQVPSSWYDEPSASSAYTAPPSFLVPRPTPSPVYSALTQSSVDREPAETEEGGPVYTQPVYTEAVYYPALHDGA